MIRIRWMTRILRWGLLLVLAGMAAGVMAQGSTGTSIHVTGAWARPADEMSAAYFRISNRGNEAVHLIAVETDVGQAAIHESRMENEVMRMHPVEALTIPAGETLVLEPGGPHVMIMNLNEPLIEGETLPLLLRFSSGEVVTTAAWISHTPIPLTLAVDADTERALAAAAAGTYVGQVVNPPVQVQDFAAPGSDEHLIRLSDTSGTWRVLFLGYMHCPDFCPLTLVNFMRVKALLGDAGREVTFIFISVDAVRDSPENMRGYLANFDPAFVGFSPSDSTLRRIQPDYGFYYQRRMDGGTQGIYTIDHSTRSYLLDRDGVLRASFAYDTEPQAMADALLWYMAHE